MCHPPDAANVAGVNLSVMSIANTKPGEPLPGWKVSEWQFSDKGELEGISGLVDLSIAYF